MSADYVSFWRVAIRWLTAILLVMSIVYPLIAQEHSAQPIVLENADSLVGRSTETEIIRDLIGNVVLRQGDAIVRCNKAIQYISRNRATLIGKVIFTQGSVTIETPMAEYDGMSRTVSSVSGLILRDRDTETRSQNGSYNTETRVARFIQNVDVQNDSIRITADTLEYRYATQNSYATGNVFASGKQSRVYLLGDSLVHIKQTNYARVRGTDIGGVYRPPLLYQIDSTRSTASEDSLMQSASTSRRMKYDTLALSGDVLESFRSDDRERSVATGAVLLVRGSLSARGERGEYVRSRTNGQSPTALQPVLPPLQYLTMLGKEGAGSESAPLMWMDSTQLYGDSLLVRLQNNRPEEIRAEGKAFSLSQADTSNAERCNQLSADRITVTIVRDTVRRIRGVGKAFSVYFQFEEDSLKAKVPNGATRVSADTIIIRIDSGSVQDVVWLNIAEGEYIPEHIAEKKINEDLRLKNFRRETNRPILPPLNARDRKRMMLPDPQANTIIQPIRNKTPLPTKQDTTKQDTTKQGTRKKGTIKNRVQ